MEDKHESGPAPSPETYRETHRGFTLTLQARPGGCRAIAVDAGGASWHAPWCRSWITALEVVRRLVDRHVDAREACQRIRERAQLAQGAGVAGAGAVELITRRPAVRE